MNDSREAVPDCLQIDDWRFCVASHRLGRDGETVKLKSRVTGLLLDLATRLGQSVSRR